MEQKAELPLLDTLWITLSRDNNWKKLAGGVAAVAVIVCIISFLSWSKEHKIVSSAEALSAIEAQGALTPTRNQDPKAYIKVATDHPGTAAGARALLQAGVAYFTQSQYADAQAQFERLNREYTENPYRAQALLGIAVSLEAQGKTDDAARTYKDVSDRFPSDVVGPQAKFNLARILESQGKLAEAFALYEELAKGEISNVIANEAGLKTEELSHKLPPKPVTPAPAAVAPAPGAAPQLTLPPTAAPTKP